MKSLGLAGVLLVGAACVTGCGGGSSANPSGLASTVAITTSPPSDISADALINFVLHFDKNGCPTTGDGSVVWPHGYTAGVTKQGVHVVVTAAGKEIRAGDAIRAGGGVDMASGKAASPCVTAGQQTTYVDGDVKVIRAAR